MQLQFDEILVAHRVECSILATGVEEQQRPGLDAKPVVEAVLEAQVRIVGTAFEVVP